MDNSLKRNTIKNIKNKRESDTWYKKSYFIYIYIYTID